MKHQDPIGIFDSGIGGLTVAHAIRQLCPQESFIYFGDTAHLPYGDKSADAIRYYSLKITKFLISKGCKAIVIACNSASSVAYEDLMDFFDPSLIVINAVDPLVHSLKAKQYRHIGVIGTQATIDAGSYELRLQQHYPETKVTSLPTPMLAPMIETGFYTKAISRDIIGTSLAPLPLEDIDALLLACTHYPLIAESIRNIVAPYNIDVYDSALPVAQELQRQLHQRDLTNTDNHGESHFYLSEITKNFKSSAELFFRQDITIEPISMWPVF